MVSEAATPFFADGMIDPAMDPFDRAILLCKQMIAMWRERVVQPEDAEADQELADGCNNTTGSPDGAVPTKCSMLGRSPNIGGAEVGCLSLQLEEPDADQEPVTGCGNATNMSNGAALADCSTLGLSPTVGGVEVVDSSQ